MRQLTCTFGPYVLTVYGGGIAVAVQRESLTGQLHHVAFLQGDEAAELWTDLRNADIDSPDVQAYLAEY